MSTNLEGAFGPACCLVLRDRRGLGRVRRLSPDLENCTVGRIPSYRFGIDRAGLPVREVLNPITVKI